MIVYVAVCHDRHTGEDIQVFCDKLQAIAYCKGFVKCNARHPEDIEERNIIVWDYYCHYSEEDDYVYVESVVLHE